MTEFTLSIFDPNTLLPHRAGISGLALALSVLRQDDAPLTWNVTDDEVQLAWDGSDREAIQWLLEQTYQVEDGYLSVPALSFDQQGKYTFTAGVTSTFLQHSKQRQQGTAINKSFTIDEGQPEISISYRPLLDCYYIGDFKEAFSGKGMFKSAIPLKGHHLPGLVECFANGAYKESPQGYLALLFLPLACGYYQLPGYRAALVIPEVTHLHRWVEQRQRLSARTYRDLNSQQQKLLQQSYGNYRTSGAAESALYFLLREKLLEDSKVFRVDYCEVYQLGKQPWDGNQSYLKQAVHRVHVSEEVLELYQSAYYLFPSQVKTTDKGEAWLAVSKALPWIANNLIVNKPWYAEFFEFRKGNQLYERKGLVTMTQDHLNAEERILFDAVQGSFRTYLRGQRQQATKQGRPLDYGQVTDKVIYRLQRPSTQQEFATALVDFLSQHRSKALKAVGPEIYRWIYREVNWRQARDLALLAIATYQGKAKADGTDDDLANSSASVVGDELSEDETYEYAY